MPVNSAKEEEEMEEIRRCPFCGGRGYVVTSKAKRKELYYTCVKCSICGSKGKTIFSDSDPEKEGAEEKQICIEAWNKRADA